MIWIVPVVAALALVSAPLSAGSLAADHGYIDDDYYEPIDGTNLHFRVRGYDKENPYLLILHGGPGSSAIEFYPWGALLEKKLNVVYLDQRGCGLSERAKFKTPGQPTLEESKGFTFENLVRDIEGVRKKLGVKSWFVLGHSFGGMVGVEYVTAYSEYVRGYVHMNGLTSMRLVNLDWLDYAERAVKQTALTAGVEERARIDEVLQNVNTLRSMSAEDRNKNIAAMVIGKITPERLRDRRPSANAYDVRIDVEALARYKISPQKMSAPEPRVAMSRVEDMSERDVFSLFEDMRTPTLILSAAGDPIIPTKRAEFMHRKIPQSRLVVIPDATHEVFKDQPEQTARAVLRFVGNHPARHKGQRSSTCPGGFPGCHSHTEEALNFDPSE